MQARSEASHAGWETRWTRAYEQGRESQLGPKGQQYIRETFGQEIGGGGPLEPIDFEEYPYDDYEFDIEY